MKKDRTNQVSKSTLLSENRKLRARLEEAEDTLRAIRSGEVDAVVVSGPHGEHIYTLKNADDACEVLLETLNEGALTLTPAGDILYCNRRFAEMIETPLERVIGSSLTSFLPLEDVEKFEAHLGKGAAESACWECALEKPSGKRLPVYCSVRAFQLNGVPAVGMVVTDLAKQKEQELIIRRMQKMEALGTLAGGIAHDINNMLSPILVNTEMALLETYGREARRSLEIVLEAAQRGRKLVKQILAFAASKEGEKRPVRLASVVEESIRLIRAAIPTTIEIRRDIAAADGMVLGNPMQIEQILLNLCSNAAYAMRERGGVLSISLDESLIEIVPPAGLPQLAPGPYLCLTVTDSGCGMTPEVMERIFDPFYTTKQASEGAGMGLAVVHGIVKSLAGAIQVASEPGKGSSFKVYFPRIESLTEPKDAKVEEMPTGNERVLMIDDEEIQLRSWKPALERHGYIVAVESEGARALRFFRAQPLRFDLVIVDQTMPGITGAKLAEEMLHLRPSLPIILCTGFSEEVNEKQALDIGVRAFLMKPFTLQELARTIRLALAQKARPDV
jgi:two-component system cell cycle sensor histidine kinase/response regulator CckA